MAAELPSTEQIFTETSRLVPLFLDFPKTVSIEIVKQRFLMPLIQNECCNVSSSMAL